MGRSSCDISEKELMRQLAAERRSTRQKDIDERNAKIAKMISFGCSYEDIARRYGLTRLTVQGLVRKGLVGPGINERFGNSNNGERACFVYDPPEL